MVVEASADMPAPPAAVYGIVADYRTGHPRILPTPPFEGLTVLEGGVGAGTRIRFGMRVMGRLYMSEAIVSEPEPGRVLAETIEAQNLVTAFIVDPAGTGSRATIRTTFPVEPGIAGRMKAMLTRSMLRRIYRRELAMLARVASTPNPA